MKSEIDKYQILLDIEKDKKEYNKFKGISGEKILSYQFEDDNISESEKFN